VTEDPVVSVVMPVHNGRLTIGAALASLAQQEDPPPFEVVVADNGSTDDTVAVVEAVASSTSLDVRLVAAHQSRGAAYARNVGAAAARGTRLVFCDCDDTYDPGFLRAMNEALDEADIVAAYHERPDEYEAHLSTGDIARRGAAHAPAHLLLGYLPAGGGGGLGVRAGRWREVDGFDNSYGHGGEDNDFYWRVQEMGGVFTTAPRAVVVYHHRPRLSGTFRQYLRYRQGAVLLQSRFPRGVTEPLSYRGAVKHLAQTLVSSPRLARTCQGRRSVAAQVGGTMGTVLGLTRYRLLGRVPPRALHSSFSETSNHVRSRRGA
jgi:glycosyltransferase involved in cell wall biosynthesis